MNNREIRREAVLTEVQKVLKQSWGMDTLEEALNSYGTTRLHVSFVFENARRTVKGREPLSVGEFVEFDMKRRGRGKVIRRRNAFYQRFYRH